MTFPDRIRLKWGMHWPHRHPPIPFRDLIHIAVIFLLWWSMATLSTAEAAFAEADHWREVWKRVVLQCLNGGSIVFDHEAFECHAEPLGVVR